MPLSATACVLSDILHMRFPCTQVRDRKARQARSSARQPMLQGAYPEPLQWTPARLTRTVLITLISGVVAGVVSFRPHKVSSQCQKERRAHYR